MVLNMILAMYLQLILTKKNLIKYKIIFLLFFGELSWDHPVVSCPPKIKGTGLDIGNVLKFI